MAGDYSSFRVNYIFITELKIEVIFLFLDKKNYGINFISLQRSHIFRGSFNTHVFNTFIEGVGGGKCLTSF